MRGAIRTIVVGVARPDDPDPRAGEGSADPVLAPAVRLALSLGAELHVVHAFELPGEPAGAGGAMRALRLAEEVEERLEARLASLPGGDGACCRAVEGPAAPRLCAVADEVEADLLVVGASRRGQACGGVLGRTAGQVLARSPLPVLVVHRPFGAVRRVLLTTDLTAAGADALRRATGLVSALCGPGAPELRCLHVVELGTLPPGRIPALERAGSERLASFLAASSPGGVPVDARVRVGDPAREIAREAAEWGADLVVVATHAHPEQGRRPLGRVAYAAVRGAPCNVLAVPAAVGAGLEAIPSPRSARVPEAVLAAG